MIRRLIPFLVAMTGAAAVHSWARDPGLGEPFEAQARQAVARFKSPGLHRANWFKVFETAWQKKCGNAAEDSTCLLEECDVRRDHCRPGHVLLFRGEKQVTDRPGISGLTRSVWDGSDYLLGGDARQLLEKLRSDLAGIRPIDNPIQMDPVVLVSGFGWFYESDPSIQLKASSPSLHPLSFRQIVFGFHAEASYFKFDDPFLGVANIDPLVSFSASPLTATGFGHRGLLLVISVPREEIVRDCGEAIPEPGSILDSSSCGRGLNEFDNEREFDAILYPNPDYVLKAFSLDGT